MDAILECMIRFIAILAVMSFVAITPLVYAQTTPGVPDALVTCDGTSVKGGTECGLQEFIKLIQNVLSLLIYLAVVGAALLFSWAGWLYLTNAQNPSNKEKAKKLFWNVVLGLVIMMGAWLIVDTLLKGVLRSGFNWNQL